MTENKKPAIRRAEILDAALTCFNRSGYYKTSVDAIAAAVGITKAGVYYYFPSKKALFIALFRSRVERYFEELNTCVEGIENTEDKIREFTRRSEMRLGKERDILKFCLEFISTGIREPDIRREVTRLFEKRVAAVSAVLQEGMASGALRQIDPEAAARTLLFLSMGFFLLHFSSQADVDRDAQYAINMQVLFEGLRKR